MADHRDMSDTYTIVDARNVAGADVDLNCPIEVYENDEFVGSFADIATARQHFPSAEVEGEAEAQRASAHSQTCAAEAARFLTMAALAESGHLKIISL